MPTKDLTIAMVGSGGDGVVTMGNLVAQAAAREGLHVIQTEAYGPQIRGGETSCTVRVASREVFAQGDTVDVLVVFGWQDFARFRGEIAAASDAVILYEAADETQFEKLDLPVGEHARWIPIPFQQLAKDSAGTTSAKNIVTLGIVAELFGLPAETIRKAVARKFSRKKASLAESNDRAFEAGCAFARGVTENIAHKRLIYEPGPARLLMSGNEACAVGALHAGCRFFAGYPITPSSEILHFLAEWMPRVGGSFVQTEDELAAIGAVIGASFAGVKSMTATSGPGLSLMIEMLGLASMAEVPAVIVDVQRGGPSTGNPTKSEQSDLLQCLYGTHGDAPRVVLACSDVEDCFHATVDAFNISEEFQLPVLVLSDQAVGQRKETIAAETLEHEVRERILPTESELTELRALPRHRRRCLAHGRPGHEGRDVPDQRARARRGRPAHVAPPGAREDEREALPQALAHPRPLSLLPALRPGPGARSASCAGARPRARSRKPCSRPTCAARASRRSCRR